MLSKIRKIILELDIFRCLSQKQLTSANFQIPSGKARGKNEKRSRSREKDKAERKGQTTFERFIMYCELFLGVGWSVPCLTAALPAPDASCRHQQVQVYEVKPSRLPDPISDSATRFTP